MIRFMPYIGVFAVLQELSYLNCDCLGDFLSEGYCILPGSHIARVMVELNAWFLVRRDNVNHLY